MKQRTGPRSADHASILQAALVLGRLFKFESCSALNRGPLKKKKRSITLNPMPFGMQKSVQEELSWARAAFLARD
jgi:hypothetical protein